MLFNKVMGRVALLRMENKLVIIMFRLIMLLSFIIVGLGIIIAMLFPLKERVPYLVKFSNASMNFAQVERADESISRNIYIRKSLVQAYVLNKETKNNIDDSIRHEIIRAQSNNSVWRVHKQIVNGKNSIFQIKDFTREINIITINMIPNTSIAQIDFKATVKDKDSIIREENFRAILKFTFNKEEIKTDDFSKNPIGFKVVSYSLDKINDVYKQEIK